MRPWHSKRCKKLGSLVVRTSQGKSETVVSLVCDLGSRLIKPKGLKDGC